MISFIIRSFLTSVICSNYCNPVLKAGFLVIIMYEKVIISTILVINEPNDRGYHFIGSCDIFSDIYPRFRTEGASPTGLEQKVR